MKITRKKILILTLTAFIGLSVASPARADWYDGRHRHHGHVPRGWVYDARLRYFVYAPAYVVVPPQPGIMLAQPAPTQVVVVGPAPPSQVVYERAPIYLGPQPPIGLNLALRVH